MPESLFHKVAGWLETRLQHRRFSLNFARFLEHLFCITYRNGCFWYLRIGLACKSVFEVFGCNFQLILNWWAPNQRTNVGNVMQVITEVYFDIQTSARGNTGITSVWLTSFKRCIRAWDKLVNSMNKHSIISIQEKLQCTTSFAEASGRIARICTH